MNKYKTISESTPLRYNSYYEECKKLRKPYAVISPRQRSKFADIVIDMDTLGYEVYENLNKYIGENRIEAFDNIHHMISSYANYNNEDDLYYCISCFSHATVRKEVAPVIVEAIYDALMDIVKNKL